MQSVIERTFNSYKLDPRKIQKCETLRNLNQQLLANFEQNLKAKLVGLAEADLESVENKLAEALTLDLGNYPAVPWITNLHKASLSSTYFAVPRARKNLAVVRRGQCVSVFQLSPSQGTLGCKT